MLPNPDRLTFRPDSESFSAFPSKPEAFLQVIDAPAVAGPLTLPSQVMSAPAVAGPLMLPLTTTSAAAFTGPLIVPLMRALP